MKHDGAVRVLRKQADRKLSPVELVENTTDRLRPTPRAPFCVSTYVSIEATCPDSCTFKGNGCYASAGFTGASLRKMDAAAKALRLSGDQVVAVEARKIDQLFNADDVPQDGARGGRDLRLHVGGDVASADGARLLAASAIRWRLRRGGSVWTYTHLWRRVPIDAWGPIRVLASVESVRDAVEAHSWGYAPALTVRSFASDRAYPLRGGKLRGGRSLKLVPCPAQTRGATCVECRLCLDRDLHAAGVAIGFALHGKQSGKVHLPVVEAA